jgi:hypothetical protein
MDSHDAKAHSTPVIFEQDSDGIFETETDFSWIPEVEIGYQWEGSRLWHTCEAINAQAQTKTFEEMKAKTYIKTTKTFTPCNQAEITQTVYDSGEGLFVYDIGHGKHVIMTSCMLCACNTSKSSLHEALDIMYKMLPIIDWTTIQTKRDWQKLPKSTVRQIKHAVYGG